MYPRRLSEPNSGMPSVSLFQTSEHTIASVWVPQRCFCCDLRLTCTQTESAHTSHLLPWICTLRARSRRAHLTGFLVAISAHNRIRCVRRRSLAHARSHPTKRAAASDRRALRVDAIKFAPNHRRDRRALSKAKNDTHSPRRFETVFVCVLVISLTSARRPSLKNTQLPPSPSRAVIIRPNSRDCIPNYGDMRMG